MTRAAPQKRTRARKAPAKKAAPEKVSNAPRFENVEIPRRGGSGGPLVIAPGATRSWGDKKCETCGRMVEPDRQKIRKGKCKCMWYQRTTTWIDVLQDEYLLKQWGNRNVAWGMSQRPDLVLSAATCKPDSDDDQPGEDKSTLNQIAKEAQEFAGSWRKATIGTSLHKLTHMLDRGETLGFIPDRWTEDIKAYEEWLKTSGVEWVSVEAFRTYDDWVSKTCPHTYIKSKDYDPENPCRCMGIAGTVDRIGWYKGRLTIFDIKTGSTFNTMGHAMQLAMYAHMVPYDIAKDERGKDISDIDLNIGYIIALPEGKGECTLEPLDLGKGWGACTIAKTVWEARKQEYVVNPESQLLKDGGTYKDMAARALTRSELRMIGNSAKESSCLTADLKDFLNQRWTEVR